MADDLKISPDEAAKALELRSIVGEFYSELSNSKIDGFDDLFLSYDPSYAIVVLVNGDEAGVKETLAQKRFSPIVPFVEIRDETVSSSELVAALAQLEKKSGLDFESWVDITDGTAHINARSEDDAAILGSLIESESPDVARTVDVRVFAAKSFNTEDNTFGGLDLNL